MRYSLLVLTTDPLSYLMQIKYVWKTKYTFANVLFVCLDTPLSSLRYLSCCQYVPPKFPPTLFPRLILEKIQVLSSDE